jgi:hypothetical protein
MPAAGWAGTAANSIRLPVRDGFFTVGVTGVSGCSEFEGAVCFGCS